MVQPTHPQTPTRPDIQVRQAQPEDRPALVAIAAQTWDGEDYLPRVLDEWYADPYQGFFVAVAQDQVVGALKLTRMGEGEWWMEGLRVAPAYHRSGIGRILHHFVLNHARRIASGIVRFSTDSMNVATRKLAAETGFEHMASFVPYEAPALDDEGPRLAQLGPADLEAVRAWLASSVNFERAQHSFEIDWTLYKLNDERLAARLDGGLVYGWRAENDRLAGLAVLTAPQESHWPDETVLQAGYLDAFPGRLPDMARALRRLAAQCGLQRVYVNMVKHPDTLLALEEAGFHREWDVEVWLFARDVSLTMYAEIQPDPSVAEDGPHDV